MTVPYGHVKFEAAGVEPVLVRLDNGRPQVTGRLGGFTEVERRKRTATTEWSGHGLNRMEVAVILDGWRERIDQRATYEALRSLGVKPSGAAHPRVVKVAGNVSGTSLSWVVEDVVPGEAITGTDGQVWRQHAVVKLLEWNPARIVVRRSAVNGAPAHYTLHRVRRGDTLAKLSKRYYGTAGKWRAIGNAQTPRIRDPRRKLKPGKWLRIP